MTTHDPEQAATASNSSPAPPVAEPSDARAAQDIAALMFKPPLDPVRRIAPAPGPTLARPRPGLSPKLPHVSGARPLPAAPAVVSEAPAPAAGLDSVPAAARAAQRSVIRHTRRFRWIALGGGAGILAVVAAGVWGLSRLAASWL